MTNGIAEREPVLLLVAVACCSNTTGDWETKVNESLARVNGLDDCSRLVSVDRLGFLIDEAMLKWCSEKFPALDCTLVIVVSLLLLCH
jgi:hypothetical protein